jgi:cytochrome c-type protein NapB
MKKLLLSFMTVISIILAASLVSVAGDQIESLRGPISIDASSVEPSAKEWQPAQKSIERSFDQQPPLIPHSIDGYDITRQANMCLVCHSKANFENTGAPMAGATHFKSLDGETLETVSASRYFCRQCHVRQVEAEPLVENTYQSPRER